MAARIKGQEVEIIILRDGAPQENLFLCKSLEFTFLTEILEEGYLGETTQRYDTVYKGVRGSLDFHYDTPTVFDVVRGIIDKAKRRDPGTRFNVKNTLNFPSGRRARLIHRDVEFGNLPFKFGERSQFGSIAVPFACSDSFALVA